jgi:hypothetical protein
LGESGANGQLRSGMALMPAARNIYYFLPRLHEAAARTFLECLEYAYRVLFGSMAVKICHYCLTGNFNKIGMLLITMHAVY